jgi:hypothetical protein
MILVLGVWTFLRALLGRSTAVTLENSALCHQLMVCWSEIASCARVTRRETATWGAGRQRFL